MIFRSACLAVLLALLPVTAAMAAPAHNPRVVNTPVSVSGAPRSLVSLVVPLPTQLEDADLVTFAVEISGRVDVLGRHFGELNTRVGQRRASVLLTIRVPSDARVGLLDVADVVFAASDGRQVVVPVILRVPSVLAIRMTGQRELLNVSAGDRVELAFRVQNLGNAPETFEVHLDAPQDWRRTLARTISLQPFGSAELPVSLRVAPGAAGNDHVIGVTLRRSGDSSTIATATTTLRAAPTVARSTGLRLDPFVAMAATRSGTGIASGVRLEGPIANGVHVFAQASPLPSAGNQDVVLAQSGAVRLPFMASVSTDRWSVQGGATQTSLNELGGVNLGGQGLTAAYDDGEKLGRMILARPGFDGRSSGSLVGAYAGMRTTAGQFGAFASVLDDDPAGFDRRRLTSVGGDYTSQSIGTVVLSGGAAIRATPEQTSLGLRGQVVHEGAKETVRLRLLHAPGGSSAFAQQSQEVMLEARRTVTQRLTVAGEYFLSGDDGGAFAKVTASGFGIGPRLAIGDRSSLSLRAYQQSSDVRPILAGVGRFGTTNTGASASLGTGAGAWDIAVDMNVMDVARRAELFSGASDEVRAVQAITNVSANRAINALGQVGVGASLQTAEAGAGVPERAGAVFGRWTGVPLFIFGQIVLAESEVRVFNSDIAGTQTALRLGANTRFRNGLDIAASLSRSPFVRDASGRQGWVGALRVGVSTEVLSGDRLRTPGVVFLDEDGDGVLDPNEKGVSGVELRYGNTRVSTNRDGRYRLPANLRGRLQVDARSLPRDLVVAPRVALDTAERRDIPLVATASRDVVLRLQADEDNRVPNVDISKSDVWLRDADGFEWVGEHIEGGRFRFRNVPAGRYVVRLGFTRLEEPVRAEEVTIELRRGEEEAVLIAVRGRTIRMISPPRGGRGSSGAPGVGPRGAAPRALTPRQDTQSDAPRGNTQSDAQGFTR